MYLFSLLNKYHAQKDRPVGLKSWPDRTSKKGELRTYFARFSPQEGERENSGDEPIIRDRGGHHQIGDFDDDDDDDDFDEADD